MPTQPLISCEQCRHRTVQADDWCRYSAKNQKDICRKFILQEDLKPVLCFLAFIGQWRLTRGENLFILLLVSLLSLLPFPANAARDLADQVKEVEALAAQIQAEANNNGESIDLPRNDPKNFISVDFDKAPLKEVIFLVSQITGTPFVFLEDVDLPISWIDQNIYKEDIAESFINVLASVGLTCQYINGKNPHYLIKKDSKITGNALTSTGVFHLKNIPASSLKDAAEALYGEKLSLALVEDNKTVVFSGSESIVDDFLFILSKIDVPLDEDLSIIRVKNISVRNAISSLEKLKIFEDKSAACFPDYWNRSVVVKGTPSVRAIAAVVVTAIDKPQKGIIDQVAFVDTIGVKEAKTILADTFDGLEVREISKRKLLLSGSSDIVEKAETLLNKIDGSGLQVKVEGIIAYLTDREFRELGMRFTYQDRHSDLRINDNITQSLITKNTGLLLDWFNDVLDFKVGAIKGDAHGQIISSPVLTVLNGQKARLHVGQNVPYISKTNLNQNSTENSATSIERHDVGVSFAITPEIDPSGEFVHLTVDQIISNITNDSELSQNAVDIVIDKKEISSTVLVADGETIFLGGLQTEENGKATDKIPFLGELPLLGRLFAYDVDKKENRHLIVSLRVNVVGKES